MKIQSYSNFWQQIHKTAKEKGLPLRVMFELTYRCNFKCKHCYVPASYKQKSKQELKTKEVYSILDQLKDLGCFYLGFTGGEPFLREDIFDILWYAKKKGFQLIIYTNGSLIDEDKVQELKRLSPNKVDITIPAISKRAFEHIAGVKRCRDKVFRTISLLYRNGVGLGFKSCLLKENEKEIKDVQNFAASLNALHRLDDRLSPRLDGDREPYRYRGILKPEISNQLKITHKEWLASCDDLGLRLAVSGSRQIPHTAHRTPHTDSLFKCGVGVSQAAITPFGELKMCVMIDYPKYRILAENKKNSRLSVIDYRLSPNTASHTPKAEYQVTKANLKEAWEKLKELVTSIKPDKNYHCDKCQLHSYCKWCPGKAWLYNRSFTSCEPESKNWAMQRKLDYEDRS